MDVKYVLSMIDTLRDGWYTFPDNYYMKNGAFDFKAYSHSAMNEIKLYLIEHPKKPPIEAIEEFRKQMDSLACKPICENARKMFSIYYDVATDVLDVLLGIE